MSERDRTTRADAQAAECPNCRGSGTVSSVTSHLGPDDYEFDENCQACNGTGSGDIRDAINALGYWTHRTDIDRIVIERAAVLRLLNSRAVAATKPLEHRIAELERAGRAILTKAYALNSDAEVENLADDLTALEVVIDTGIVKEKPEGAAVSTDRLPSRPTQNPAETCEGSLCMQTNRCSYAPCLVGTSPEVRAAAQEALQGPQRTGWPPGLLQDDSREFSRWLSSRPDAPRHARDAAAAITEVRAAKESSEPAAPDARRPMTEAEIDEIANDGMRNAAGGIYATRVYEFARAIERHHAIGTCDGAGDAK